jgi:curved DNA-binding protein
MKDYYTILGVTQSSSEDEIRKSYRKLAMRFHPDRNPDDPESEEKFKEIAEAYGVLTDPIKRREYDACGYSHNRQSSGDGFSYSQEDILRDLFKDPRFQHLMQGLLREFQRSGFRGNSHFIKQCFLGGKGGFVVGGIFLFGSLAGPTLLNVAKKGLLSAKMPLMKKVGNAVSSMLTGKNCATNVSTPKNVTDTTYHIPLSANELRQGKWIQVAINGDKGQELLRVKIPAGSKAGQKLRVPGKGRPGPAGRGDLFLYLAE